MGDISSYRATVTLVVGFAGTRKGPTPAQHNTMRWFLGGLPISRFVHGGAKGCDTLAHHVVRLARGNIPIEIYPAHHDQGSVLWGDTGPTTSIHGAREPLERNRVIVSRIHGLVAVPATDVEGDSGTWATIRDARQVGCPVYLVMQNGRIVRDGRAF